MLGLRVLQDFIYYYFYGVFLVLGMVIEELVFGISANRNWPPHCATQGALRVLTTMV